MRFTVSCAVMTLTATAFAVVPHGETVDVGFIEERVVQSLPSIENDLLGRNDVGEYFPPLDQSTLADPNDPSSVQEYSTPVERALSFDANEDLAPLGPTWDWGDDYMIYPGPVGTGVDFEQDIATGDLYAVFDTDHINADSLLIYKSTDGGMNWSFFNVSTNSDGQISNPGITVCSSGGTTWVVVIGIWHETGDDILWSRRIQSNGSGAVFEQVATTPTSADIDSDVGSSAYAYVTWADDGDDIFAARNALTGSAWVDSEGLFVDPGVTPYPCIAVGAGGNVSISFIDNRLTTTPEFRIKRSTTSGASWLGSEQVSNNTGGYDLTWMDLEFNHQTTQVGWMIAEWAASTDNIAYYYTEDSGASWTYGAVIGHVDIEEMPRLGAWRTTANGGVTLAYNADPGNMCMMSWASGSTPTSFATPEQINDPDHYNTGNFPPAAGWTTSYSAVMFASYNNNYAAYFDWWTNTGIADESTAPVSVTGLQNSPNPFYGTTRIDFNLMGTGRVSLEVFDVSGHLVSTPIDGQNLEAGDHSVQWNAGASLVPGVYFSRLTSGDQELTHRMVLMP